jgi:hypothetical protein
MSTGTDEISRASDDLSRRTEQQAASLEETAAALNEITNTVRRTADGSTEASQVVTKATKEAQEGGLIVSRAVEAMSEISKSANQISQIIGKAGEKRFVLGSANEIHTPPHGTIQHRALRGIARGHNLVPGITRHAHRIQLVDHTRPRARRTGRRAARCAPAAACRARRTSTRPS